ncbi:MAG: hypothetical protein KIT09_14450 [Bryobacteraceae bacterium]|nr:hypothetical protein [Bryobacteraceae bacterium]
MSARSALQLTPEMAEEISPFDGVVIVDADIEPGATRLAPIEANPAARSPLGHSIGPDELLLLARKLYGFQGRAWLCRVPGVDFNEGDGLSETAESNAAAAARLLLEMTRQGLR